MIKRLKRKKQRTLLLLCMIVVGMNLLAIIFAAVGYAAVRVANGSPRLVFLKRQRRLFFD